MSKSANLTGKAALGVPGLDDILGGGLTRNRLYLLEGDPGTGKTTIAMQFLMEGARLGERVLHISLSETENELRDVAQSHGWTFGEGLEIFELNQAEIILDDKMQQSLLYSADLELGESTKKIFERVGKVNPTRVVLDSLSEIRLLAGSSLRYRRQILALKHYFARQGTTVLMLDDLTSEALDKAVHSIAHGAIRLEELAPGYGAERRRLRVMKYRGQRFRGGYHDFAITTGGVKVFPRLVSLEHKTTFARKLLASGIPELDALLIGGIHTGSGTLILGPAGTGKSLFAVQYVCAAVARGETAAMFIFDEELGLLFQRTRAMGFELQTMRDSGQLVIEQVDAAELSPGEFAHKVRVVVEELQAKTVVIDSLNGYQSSMPEENALILHVHELLQFLNRQGATTFVTVAQHGLIGDLKSPVDLTHLADTVILLRYFEALGQMRRAISVVKKRTGAHEDTIREYRISNKGLRVGEPIRGFQGVLSGVSRSVDVKPDLLDPSAV